ncbi:MAG: tyrosine-type recombinase/integrase [Planctomycetes bacterium]|nr:tyrosine-type recombinase/integrase [Planctomycetota bacterium]
MASTHHCLRRFHTLRHTIAVHFLEGGTVVTDLQGVLGNADFATTQIYAHIVDSRTRESLVALDYGGLTSARPGSEVPSTR